MDDQEKGQVEDKNSSNTTLYFVFVMILVVAVGGSYYFGRKSGEAKEIAIYSAMKPVETNTNRPSGPPSIKGQKFTDLPFANNASQIYPGTISASAKAAMSGWILKTLVQPDGSTQVSLVPTGSEATEGDTAHTFTVKTGDKLYFVDLNPNDDGATEDKNARDDMGILVDANGIVQ